MRPLDIRTPVKRGLELARSKFRVNGGVAVETELPANLPKILGDEGALAEAVAHLVANAAEALTEQKKPKITLSAKPRSSAFTMSLVRPRAAVTTLRLALAPPCGIGLAVLPCRDGFGVLMFEALHLPIPPILEQAARHPEQWQFAAYTNSSATLYR